VTEQLQSEAKGICSFVFLARPSYHSLPPQSFDCSRQRHAFLVLLNDPCGQHPFHFVKSVTSRFCNYRNTKVHDRLAIPPNCINTITNDSHYTITQS
jgi:hypothetical protein